MGVLLAILRAILAVVCVGKKTNRNNDAAREP